MKDSCTFKIFIYDNEKKNPIMTNPPGKVMTPARIGE